MANCVSLATAQSLVPGIHAMSTVQGIKFTWIRISSDNEVSINIRNNGTSTTPGVMITATALTNPTKSNQSQSTSPTAMAGSRIHKCRLGFSG